MFQDNADYIYYYNEPIDSNPSPAKKYTRYTYHHSLEDVIKGIVFQKKKEDFIDLKVSLPMSIVLCFLKFRSNQLCVPLVNHHFVNCNNEKAIDLQQYLQSEVNPSIGHITLKALKSNINDNHPFGFKLYGSTSALPLDPVEKCYQLDISENSLLCRFLADMVDRDITLFTTKERYYFLQKFYFTVFHLPDNVMKIIKDAFDSHVTVHDGGSGESLLQYTQRFFESRIDEALVALEIDTIFTNEVMNDIYLFVDAFQSNSFIHFGVVDGIHRTTFMAQIFASEEFRKKNSNNLFTYKKTDVTVLLEDEDLADSKMMSACIEISKKRLVATSSTQKTTALDVLRKCVFEVSTISQLLSAQKKYNSEYYVRQIQYCVDTITELNKDYHRNSNSFEPELKMLSDWTWKLTQSEQITKGQKHRLTYYSLDVPFKKDVVNYYKPLTNKGGLLLGSIFNNPNLVKFASPGYMEIKNNKDGDPITVKAMTHKGTKKGYSMSKGSKAYLMFIQVMTLLPSSLKLMHNYMNDKRRKPAKYLVEAVDRKRRDVDLLTPGMFFVIPAMYLINM